jgi:hypothetical protein
MHTVRTIPKLFIVRQNIINNLLIINQCVVLKVNLSALFKLYHDNQTKGDWVDITGETIDCG